MIEASGYTVRDADNPDGDIEIAITGLRPGEKLHEELLIGEGHLTTAHEKIFAAREAVSVGDRDRLGPAALARGRRHGRRCRRPRGDRPLGRRLPAGPGLGKAAEAAV